MFNHTGYFCCEDGQTGFWTDSPPDAVGCSNWLPSVKGDNDFGFVDAELVWSIFSVMDGLWLIGWGPGSAPSSGSSMPSTSTSLSVPTTPSASTSMPLLSSATTTSSTSKSSDHTGAIAGGVVGGVAGLALVLGIAWFVLRRRRRAQVEPSHPVREPDKQPAEMTGLEVAPELEHPESQLVHELPGESGMASPGAANFR